MVLWTRLAPDPLFPAVMPAQPVPVGWEIAEDESFYQVVARGVQMAAPEVAHSVHVEVAGLRPASWYWYRFRAGSELSPVGRTRTAPAPSAATERLRFAFASCQMYEHGYYTAYRHMANEDLDLVLHLGDYIYEYAPYVYRVPSGNVRRHDGPEVDSLDSYRNRHALYRTDPDLQAAHAVFPWMVTWDDHEVDNNYADEIPEDDQDIQRFLARRANAYRAYYEHMPLRRRSLPDGADMPLYRRLAWGDLANLSLLDTRQYRSDQACGDRLKPPCNEWDEPKRTLTGTQQERWLLDGLVASTTTWNVIPQQVFMAQRDFAGGEAVTYSMDAWDGYPAARGRILTAVQQRAIRNLMVLTGDVHSNWAADLKADFDDPESATLGSELVGTSISSGGDGSDTTVQGQATLAENPHILFHNAQRGYVRCDVSHDLWRADYQVLPYVSRPGAPIHTRASFVVQSGTPGLQSA